MSTMRCEPSWKMPTLGEAARPRTASRARWRYPNGAPSTTTGAGRPASAQTAPSAAPASSGRCPSRRSAGSRGRADGEDTPRRPRAASGARMRAGRHRSTGRRDRVDLCDAASLPSRAMSDSDAPPRIVRMASSRRGRRAPTRPAVPDVTRRLATLERQVEEALAGSGQPATLVPSLESLVDGFVDGYSRLRRAVAGEREATTELLSAPLDLLYRWWWRVDVIGLERLPARGPVLRRREPHAAPCSPTRPSCSRVRSAGRHPARAPDARRLAARAFRWSERPLRRSAPSPRRPIRCAASWPPARWRSASPRARRRSAKPLARRYRLAPFGRASLVRVASEAGAPVVPVAVVGAEEAQPVLWRSEWLGRLLGLPAVPVPPPFVLAADQVDDPRRRAARRRPREPIGAPMRGVHVRACASDSRD